MFIIFYCYIKISVDDCGEEMKKANEVVWEGGNRSWGSHAGSTTEYYVLFELGIWVSCINSRYNVL